MKTEEKRFPRSYKVSDSAYDEAMKFAKKKNTTLAELIEAYVKRLAKKNDKLQKI